MGQISLSVPQIGLPNSTEQPKEVSNFSTLQTVINGNLDSTNLAATLAQSAGVNVSGQASKGVTVNAGSGTRTNVAYGALNDAADQVTGIVLPTNGLIEILYQATFQESVSGAARAAIFIGANQLKVGWAGVPALEAAATGGSTAATNWLLTTCPIGLVGNTGFAYSGDATTGQAIAAVAAPLGALNTPVWAELNGQVLNSPVPAASTMFAFGGPCQVFAAAGTYTISVQFKASSGTVTASNRKLWVRTKSFA